MYSNSTDNNQIIIYIILFIILQPFLPHWAGPGIHILRRPSFLSPHSSSIILSFSKSFFIARSYVFLAIPSFIPYSAQTRHSIFILYFIIIIFKPLSRIEQGRVLISGDAILS